MSEFSRRAALLTAESELAPPPLESVRRAARRYRLRRRLRAGVAACAVTAVAAGGVAWVSAGPAGPSPEPLAPSGPIQALSAPATARVPAEPVSAPGKPGTWRLASHISEPLSWSRRDSGPPAGGDLSCPQAGTCFFTGPAAGSAYGPAPSLSILYVSGDGGLSWTAIRMPGGVSFTTALACPAAGDCVAGGEVSGRAVLLISSDGGYRWSYRALPPGDGAINQLVCVTTADCRAIASPSAQAYLNLISEPTWFLTTDDTGGHWTGYRFPDGADMRALSCLNASDCVAVGRSLVPGAQAPTELRSTDEGRTWTAGSLPAGLELAGGVACVGTSTCYAVGNGWEGSGWSSVAVSTDGGASWRVLALPPDTPQPGLGGISCPSATDCWVAGTQAVPQTIPSSGGPQATYSDYSAMILATSDGGATWSKITFAVGTLAPGQQPDSLLAVEQIACPAVGSCAAAGWAEQGSDSTAVYTTSGG